jgi:hypothetical protein
MPFGKFTGADMLFHDFGLRTMLRAGDIIFFQSWLLRHSSIEARSGVRYTLVLFTHHRMLLPEVRRRTKADYLAMAIRRRENTNKKAARRHR